jgi:glycopeptide antibiotics resistance protein
MNFRYNRVASVAFAAYAVVVIAITIIPLPATDARFAASLNFVPFGTLMECARETLANPSDLVTRCIANVLGNLVLLFPFGLLAPILFPVLRLLPRFLLTALGIAAGIELLQLLETLAGGRRTPDIDDIILNVIGALMGFFLFRFFVAARYPREIGNPG